MARLQYAACMAAGVLAVGFGGLIRTYAANGSAAAWQESGQQDSVAEAARKAREAKRSAPKASKVVTDDDLKPMPANQAAAQTGAASGSGGQSAGAANASATSSSGAATAAVDQSSSSDEPSKPAAPAMTGGVAIGTPPRTSAVGPSTKDVAEAETANKAAHTSPADAPVKESDSAEVKAAKAELATAEADLEAAKDELGLEQDNVYKNPDYARDKAGQTKLDALKQQVADRQAEVDKKRAKVGEAVKGGEKP